MDDRERLTQVKRALSTAAGDLKKALEYSAGLGKEMEDESVYQSAAIVLLLSTAAYCKDLSETVIMVSGMFNVDPGGLPEKERLAIAELIDGLEEEDEKVFSDN